MSFEMARLVVVTDLDGTLLDITDSSFAAAKPALNRLRMLQIPWVMNSSKTLAELNALRERLVNPYPIILENGSGIALPKGFENAFYKQPDEDYQEHGDFLLKPMGMPRNQLLELLEPAYDNYDFQGFARMSPEELRNIIPIGQEQAELSLDRNFNEPILWKDTDEAFEEFSAWASSVGLDAKKSYTFAHVSNSADKGAGMEWLMNCFSYDGLKPLIVALGDAESDVPMLNASDIAVVVRSPRHPLIQAKGKLRTIVTDDYGPLGWNTAVLDILDKYGD